jgi:hypothetical protein
VPVEEEEEEEEILKSTAICFDCICRLDDIPSCWIPSKLNVHTAFSGSEFEVCFKQY